MITGKMENLHDYMEDRMLFQQLQRDPLTGLRSGFLDTKLGGSFDRQLSAAFQTSSFEVFVYISWENGVFRLELMGAKWRVNEVSPEEARSAKEAGISITEIQ